MKYKDSNGQWQTIKVKNYGIEQTPIGSMIYYPSQNIPAGYLVCDGSEKLIADYPLLFNAIGYIGGEDVDTGYFRLPDMRANVPAGFYEGLDSSNPLAGNFGDQVGAPTHILTVDEMPSHNHYNFAGSGGSVNFPAWASKDNGAISTAENGYGSSTTTTGSNQPHSIVQPTKLYHWLIKAKNVTSLGGYTEDFNVEGIFYINNKNLFDVLYPVGSTYTTKNATNPSSYLGGTWELVRNYMGGELIAFGHTYNNGTALTVSNDAYKSWSDIFAGDNQTISITNYTTNQILSFEAGTFKINSHGIAGLIEATITLSGNKNSQCYAIWFSDNKNVIPSGATQLGNNRQLLTLGTTGNTNYGGTSNNYLYQVTAGPNTNVSFYINPSFIAYPSGAEFYPGNGGVTCSLSVKVYTTKETRYVWRKTALTT